MYAELSPKPIAAASLGQVYKGRLKTGEVVAVKVRHVPVSFTKRAAWNTLLSHLSRCARVVRR